jgi:aspartyl-tRNA(Asn)/glutamyl-tRNA(Gln) amidotransferase subunit A
MKSEINPLTLTVSSAQDLLARKVFSVEELSEACRKQAEKLNPIFNAFITLLGDQTRTESANLSSKGTNQLPLFGIPIAVKDLYETKGILTTSGTPFFKDYIPAEDCVVVKKLKNAGAIITGKTNTHEIALGVTGINPHFGVCHNPWDVNRISGGSSSGSTVAVATGMSLAAVGTDTGGSIRIPAALCGMVGLKPTYGRVSLRGITPLSWNLDHAGPLTKSVKDAAILLQVIAGYDSLDPASANISVEDYSLEPKEFLKGWKVAIASGDYIDESDSEILDSVKDSTNVFEALGAEVVKEDMEILRNLALANGRMVQADAAAFHRERLSAYPDWFGADIRERLEAGRSLSSTDYSLARRTQIEGRRQMDEMFQRYDLLILPTTPIIAPLIEGNDALEQARRLTRFTAPFNLTGLPALSIPCGFDSKGMPIGLQLVGKAWGEANLLKAGHAYESATEWHRKLPPI